MFAIPKTSFLRIPVVATTILQLLLSCSAYDHETEMLVEKGLLRKDKPRGTLVPDVPVNMKSRKKDVCFKDGENCETCYDYGVRGFLTEFQYFPTKGIQRVVPIIPHKEFRNNCSEEYMMAQAYYSFNRTHTYSWSFNVPLDFVLLMSITSAYPSVPWSKKAEDRFGGLSYGPASGQMIQFQENVLYEDDIEIVVPPGEEKRLTVEAFWTPVDLAVPFLAHVEFSTNPITFCTSCSNGTSRCRIEAPSSKAVERYLIENGFRGTIVGKTGEYVKAAVHGVFKGDYGEKVLKSVV